MEGFIVGYLLPILGSFIAVIVSAIATIFTRWLYRKLGKNLTAQQEVDMTKAIEDAIWAAEEKGAKQLKEGSVIPGMTSKLKYSYVLDFIGNRFPELTREQAEMKVDAILGKTEGLGASGCVQSPCACSEPKISDEKNWRVVEDDRPVITP